MTKEYLYEGAVVKASPMTDFDYKKMRGLEPTGKVRDGFHIREDMEHAEYHDWVAHDDFLRDAVEVETCSQVTPLNVIDALEFAIEQIQGCTHFTTMKCILPLNGMIKEIKNNLDKHEREERAKRTLMIADFIKKFTDDEEEADHLNDLLRDFL